jgi:hypothetical protein
VSVDSGGMRYRLEEQKANLNIPLTGNASRVLSLEIPTTCGKSFCESLDLHRCISQHLLILSLMNSYPNCIVTFLPLSTVPR